MIYILMGVIIVVIIALLLLNKDNDKDLQRESFEPISLEYEDNSINYKEYHLTKADITKYSVIGYGLIFLVAYVFYANLLISLIAGLVGVLLPRFQRNNLRAKRQSKLTMEFKDALYSIYTSLSAGESPENALMQVPSDMRELYIDDNTYIIPEFEVIKRRLELNLSIKEVLEKFADRTGVDDIENFVDIFITSMDTGGKQSEIIKSAINTIVEKIEIKRDIDLMISSKKYESQLMTVMPVIVILFLGFASKEYMEPLYTTSMGRAVMTIVIIGMLGANKMSKMIMNIEV